MRARCLKTARAPCPSSRRCASRRAATMGPFGAATQFLHAHVVSRLLSRLPGAEREDDEKALSEDVRVGNRPGCDDPLEPKTPGRTPSTDERGGARSGASAGETSPEPSASASPPASPWRRRFAPCASPKRRGDGDLAASAVSPPASPPATPAPAVPWEDLPEECVERIFLSAGFQSALSATAACTAWRRVASSPHFWRKLFVVHFGRGEADAEAARLRRARRNPDPDLDLDPDVLPTPLDDRAAATAWRLAFRDAVRAEWLWASGRCAQTRNLRRHGARVVRVALHGGRAVTASLDGTVRIHDVKTGSEIRIRDEHDVGDGDGAASAEFGELGQTAADRLADASSATPLRSPATPLRSHPPAPVLCLAASDGVAAAGTSDGFVTAYDVSRGAKMHRTRFGRAPVVSVAVGAGWIVAGLADGSTETRAVADGGVVARGRVARPSPTMCDIVRCVEIHPESGYAAAVAGAEVVAWKLERDDDKDDNHSVCDSGGAACPIARRAGGRSPSTRRLEGHVEPVRCVCFASLRPRADGTSRVAVVTGGDDGTIRAFDPVTGRCLREMEGPPGTTEAEHAGQVPVGWTYRPPPGITCVAAWAGQVVEARDDGSVLVWTNALDDVSDDEGDEDENDENDENGRDDGSVGESSDAARAVAALVRQLSGEGGFRRPRSDPIEGEGEGEGASASASASWSQSRSRSRSRSLARRRRRRPAAYRRWWPHSDAVTGVVARGGRVVSVSEDGGCHVLPLPEDVLARAHAHLAAENRAWAARASAAARSEARTEEHAHESLEASASWARTRAGGFDVFGFDGGAPRRLSSEFMSVAYRYTNLAWREGSAAAAAAAAESWRVADLLSGGAVSAAADVTYAATHAAADRAWTTGVRPAVSAASAAASMAAETAAVAERLGREAARAAGARIVGHVGQFAPSRGLTFREHNAAAWCVAADRETLVTGDADGNVFARYFGPPEEPRFEWR